MIPAVGVTFQAHGDLADLRELEGVRKQILQHLAEALGVRTHGLREPAAELNRELQSLRYGDGFECLLEVLAKLGEGADP